MEMYEIYVMRLADRMRLWKSGGYGILDIEWIPDRSGETGGACLWQNM